jgi:putative SOS response-associated peptidase YedK
VSVHGFYEWSRRGEKKQPFYFHMKDKELFAIAGLWERWQGEEVPLETCTLVRLLTPEGRRGSVIGFFQV